MDVGIPTPIFAPSITCQELARLYVMTTVVSRRRFRGKNNFRNLKRTIRKPSKMELHEVCEFIIDCEHKTAPTQDAGYPSIRTPNVGPGYFILENVNRVSEETYRLWTQRAAPQPGDLIMAREAPVGNVAIIPEGLFPCLGQRTLLIRPNRAKVNPCFLNYFLNGPHGQGLIHAKTNGATVAHLNMKDVRTMDLPKFPPLPVQRKIAGILSAYDELIENSQQRIKILESMARSLYREWFVNFRFPGHEKVKLLPSPLGDIPKGWEVEKLADICRVIPGYAFKSSGWQSSGIPVVKIKNIRPDNLIDIENTDFVTDDVFQATPKKFILGLGDILIAMTGATAGKLGKLRVKTPFLLNQRVAKIQPDPSFYSFIWCAISTEEAQERFFRLADGAAQPNMSGSQIEGVEIICPPINIANEFTRLVDPILNHTDTLYLQIQKLRQTRDLLLPRLLSGQINLGESK
jgi:type I restriction enzyme S subunit